MVWDVPDYLWEQNYHAALQYHREHGDLDVPYYYVTPDGVRLGTWIANIRFARRNEGTGRAELTFICGLSWRKEVNWNGPFFKFFRQNIASDHSD